MNTKNDIIINYKIGKEDKIRLFGDKFIENNKSKIQIIIDDENYELNSFYKLTNQKENEILKIKLKQIKNLTDLSYMFKGCSSLIESPDTVFEGEFFPSIKEFSKEYKLYLKCLIFQIGIQIMSLI